MRISEFAYDLPPERIAQEPAAQRDGSRLMKLDRATGEVAHLRFTDLPGLLEPGDLLVLNDTRVVPARIVAEKPAGGRAEVLLLERLDGAGTIRASALPARAGEVQQWRALVRGFPR
ncbi:MAG TPA: S-adenosylmethionine:tRNA ribosyltransferase-isomerase, partial [Candidatus Saccharimonadales bacterium]|nr:S-adenosylmethionine:tRNA ribosyltransferase-isomerase [Candidatus Saccharimonadales bacterium]